MTDWCRRRLLTAAAAGLAAVAGCTTTDDPPPSPGLDRRPANGYEVEQVRNTDAVPLFTRESFPTATSDGEGTGRPAGSYDYAYVVSEAYLDDLTFAAVSEAQRLRSFAADTDFETESVYLFTTPVGACYDVRIEAITLDPDDDPHGDFCRTLRPADVACDDGEYDTVGYAIRLPVTRERTSGHGGGMSSSCRRAPSQVAFDAKLTPHGSEEE
ncbi:hypothetical protein GOC83_16840 [Haloarcula rubripromontorii]|uniref:Lipoprotein n=1 Tax=Haloarcula rubripromontorii TaxID=1705562 RepID=A0A847TX20_9EURY|nr:hypothetical protein [Haloarcula rubripromontorii]NLV07803.1 hypothetical protein [Haloarcula rubripromontorii]